MSAIFRLWSSKNIESERPVERKCGYGSNNSGVMHISSQLDAHCTNITKIEK